MKHLIIGLFFTLRLSAAMQLDPLLATGNKLIQLEPGVYECKGWAGGAYILDGTVLRGAGMGLTTIKLTDLARDQWGGQNTVLFTGFNDFRNIVVSDLTIDCNWQGLGVTNATLQGIALRGGDHLIERVRVINAAGAWAHPNPGNNPESFILSIFATPSAAGRSLTIRDCVVEDFRYGSCTALTTSYTERSVGTICRIENNLVRLNQRGGEFGLGMAGTRHGVIRGNTIIGGNRGLNYEAAASEHIMVTGNAFLSQYSIAALLGGGSNSQFTDNIIETVGDRAFAILISGPNDLFSGVDGWQIQRNLFVSKGTARTVSSIWPAAKTGRFRLQDNVWVGKWTGVKKH